ncbi:MAG: type II secretion system protein N [Pseudomonas sp.]
MTKGWNIKAMVVCALLLYVLTLLWNLPAAFVWKRLEGQLPTPVTLHGLTGTLWSGQVARMEVDGIDQGQLSWDWLPSRLLRGQIGLDLLWQPRNGKVNAQLHAGLGSLTISQINGTLDAASMAAINNAPFVLRGVWLLDVPELALKDFESVVAANGRLVWQDAAGGLPQAMPFGHLTATLEDADGWLLLHLQDQGGPLGLMGDARWRPGQPMKLNVQLQARPDAERGLADGLGLLGQPNAQGWVSWRAQLQ